jgi:hypothetical protein
MVNSGHGTLEGTVNARARPMNCQASNNNDGYVLDRRQRRSRLVEVMGTR